MEHKTALLLALGSLQNEVSSKASESGVVGVGVLVRKCCPLGKEDQPGLGQ